MGQQPGTFDHVTLVDLGGSVKFTGGAPYICLCHTSHFPIDPNPLNLSALLCLLCPALLLYKAAFAALLFATHAFRDSAAADFHA